MDRFQHKLITFKNSDTLETTQNEFGLIQSRRSFINTKRDKKKQRKHKQDCGFNNFNPTTNRNFKMKRRKTLNLKNRMN